MCFFFKKKNLGLINKITFSEKKINFPFFLFLFFWLKNSIFEVVSFFKNKKKFFPPAECSRFVTVPFECEACLLKLPGCFFQKAVSKGREGEGRYVAMHNSRLDKRNNKKIHRIGVEPI